MLQPVLRYDEGHFFTEVLQWAPEDTTIISAHVIIIPGNPGLGQIYSEFGAFLREYLDSSVTITVLSHLGQHEKTPYSTTFFSLEDQIRHKLWFIDELSTRTPVYVVGHSIGAHMALEMLRQNRKQVHGILGLFPFLQFDEGSRHQCRMRSLVNSQLVVSCVARLMDALAVLPDWVQAASLSKIFAPEQSPAANKIVMTNLFQNSAALRQATFLAVHEFVDLAREPDWNFLREVAPMVKFVFTPNDHWGPLWMHRKVQEKVPNLASYVMEHISHSFCTKTEEARVVAKRTADLLKGMMEQGIGM